MKKIGKREFNNLLKNSSMMIVDGFKVDDVTHSGNMNASVKDFKEFLSFCVCVK